MLYIIREGRKAEDESRTREQVINEIAFVMQMKNFFFLHSSRQAHQTLTGSAEKELSDEL